jgi:hypothetical protein
VEKERVTFTQYLLNEQESLSSTTGNFYYDLVIQLCQVAKRIARELNRAPCKRFRAIQGKTQTVV